MRDGAAQQPFCRPQLLCAQSSLHLVTLPCASLLGGTLLLGTEGFRIGPGQTGITLGMGSPTFSFHYYDGRDSGAHTLGMGSLSYTSDGWPQVSGVCG